jgi:hypothetical protein
VLAGGSGLSCAARRLLRATADQDPADTGQWHRRDSAPALRVAERPDVDTIPGLADEVADRGDRPRRGADLRREWVLKHLEARGRDRDDERKND